MLSDEQIEKIHVTMLEALAGTGIQITHARPLELLDAAGAGDVYEMASLIAGGQKQLQQAPSTLGTGSSPAGPGPIQNRCRQR